MCHTDAKLCANQLHSFVIISEVISIMPKKKKLKKEFDVFRNTFICFSARDMRRPILALNFGDGGNR